MTIDNRCGGKNSASLAQRVYIAHVLSAGFTSALTVFVIILINSKHTGVQTIFGYGKKEEINFSFAQRNDWHSFVLTSVVCHNPRIEYPTPTLKFSTIEWITYRIVVFNQAQKYDILSQ